MFLCFWRETSQNISLVIMINIKTPETTQGPKIYLKDKSEKWSTRFSPE